VDMNEVGMNEIMRRPWRGVSFVSLMVLILLSVPATASGAECQPRPRTQCAGADLTGVNFGGKDLRGANLRGATLSNANLSDAILSKSDLRRVNFRGADLANSYLDGANLSGADLRDANVFGSYLKNVRLKNTRLDGVDLSQTQGIRKADVLSQQARLCNTTLPGGTVSNRNC
jgi:uncharacterized protein YjbI with pentapeptide repeats